MIRYILLFLLSLECIIASPLLSAETVKVASIFAFSGMAASANSIPVQGVRYGVEEINRRGGILGRQIELIELDNKSTPIGSKVAADLAVKKDVIAIIGASWSSHSLAIAKVAQSAGIPMIIAKGFDPTIIGNVMDGHEIGTLFLETKIKLNARKHWINYEATKKGTIFIDDGAITALKSKNSLLSIGILKCEGNFHKGEVVSICDNEQNEIAVGISNYSQIEVDLIKGKNSSDIIHILGYKDYNEVVHMDNMFIF